MDRCLSVAGTESTWGRSMRTWGMEDLAAAAAAAVSRNHPGAALCLFWHTRDTLSHSPAPNFLSLSHTYSLLLYVQYTNLVPAPHRPFSQFYTPSLISFSDFSFFSLLSSVTFSCHIILNSKFMHVQTASAASCIPARCSTVKAPSASFFRDKQVMWLKSGVFWSLWVALSMWD